MKLKPLKAKLARIPKTRQISVAIATSGVAVVAILGSLLFSASQAAGPFAAAEPEQGALAAPAATLTDATASNNGAIRFAQPGSGGACPQPKRTVTAADVTNRTNSGYPAGTQLYVPDGPDPWGGCFPGPGTTGIPAGTQLTAYTGPCTITVANTVIDAKSVNCSLIIRAANVQIRNSKLVSGDIGIQSGSLLLTDSEVDGGSYINSEGLKGTNFTLRRVDMYGGKRQVWCNNTCTIEDSYFHDQLTDPTGVTHESSVRVEINTTLRHNTMHCNAPTIPPDAGCSANQTGYPDFAPIHDNTLDRNLYMATTGGVCSYGGASNGKPYSNDPLNAVNIHSTNNVFQRGIAANDRTSIALTDKRRYTCGYYGVVSSYDSSKPGYIFSGNMWDDGLLFANDTTYPYGGFPL